eukprot:gene8142-8983_t
MRKSSNLDEVDVIHSLNISIFHHLSSLQIFFQDWTNRTLFLDFVLHHNYSQTLSEHFPTPSERVQEEGCVGECLWDCSDYVIEQAEVGRKDFLPFLHSLLGQPLEGQVAEEEEQRMKGLVDLQPTLSFGSAQGLLLLHRLSGTVDEAEGGVSLQAGGGSGWGFQLYCDGDILMTSGAGGGGGFYLNTSSTTFNFGGGGGGGLQFINSSSFNSSTSQTSQSVGGGGGCGSCDEETFLCSSLGVEGGQAITCGFKRDDDALQGEALLEVITATRQSLDQCNDITIQGGGGGGGGTGACCWPFRIGYGFSFSLSSASLDKEPSASSASSASSSPLSSLDSLLDGNSTKESDSLEYTDSLHSNTSHSNGSGLDETGLGTARGGEVAGGGYGDNYRYQYDIAGKLLFLASQSCSGFSDWCCVTTSAKDMISRCLEANTTRAILTDHLLSANCTWLLNDYPKVQWLLVSDNAAVCQRRSGYNSSDYSAGNSTNTFYTNTTEISEDKLSDYERVNISLPSLNFSSLREGEMKMSQYFVIYLNNHENDWPNSTTTSDHQVIDFSSFAVNLEQRSTQDENLFQCLALNGGDKEQISLLQYSLPGIYNSYAVSSLSAPVRMGGVYFFTVVTVVIIVLAQCYHLRVRRRIRGLEEDLMEVEEGLVSYESAASRLSYGSIEK